MRLLKFALLLSSTFFRLAYSQTLPAPKDTVATRYLLPGADCALFPAAARLGRQDEYMPKIGRFTPTREQVASVEKKLPTVRLQDVYEHHISSYYAAYPSIIKEHLSEYKRQYYGFYNLQHQPCLFINFFPGEYERSDDKDPYWLRWPVFVYDGGAGFWRIWYNLATHKFYNFSYNMEG